MLGDGENNCITFSFVVKFRTRQYSPTANIRQHGNVGWQSGIINSDSTTDFYSIRRILEVIEEYLSEIVIIKPTFIIELEVIYNLSTVQGNIHKWHVQFPSTFTQFKNKIRLEKDFKSNNWSCFIWGYEGGLWRKKTI